MDDTALSSDPANSDPATSVTARQAVDPGEVVQVIGSRQQFMSGAKPQLREMRIDDLEDDCPICQINRARILDGDPPMVYAFD